MKKFFSWMKKELIEAIPGLVFFITTFNLIDLTERLILRADDISLSSAIASHVTATLGAIVLVKALLIINSLTYMNRFPQKPLIYNITWKFFIYGFFTFLFRLLDLWLHLYFKIDKAGVAFQELKVRLISPTFWAIELWVLMLFVVYIVAEEFTRVLGRDKVLRLLFG